MVRRTVCYAALRRCLGANLTSPRLRCACNRVCRILVTCLSTPAHPFYSNQLITTDLPKFFTYGVQPSCLSFCSLHFRASSGRSGQILKRSSAPLSGVFLGLSNPQERSSKRQSMIDLPACCHAVLTCFRWEPWLASF